MANIFSEVTAKRRREKKEKHQKSFDGLMTAIQS
jgi:hypothetical protein